MKIGIVGTRGIPAKYGGFETFAEEISVRLVKLEVVVVVYSDKNAYLESKYKGVEVSNLETTKSANPLLYYYLGLKLAFKECDIVLVAGLGGAIFYPFIKKYSGILLTNTDGVEYNRGKWSFLKSWFLRLSEYLNVKLSDYLIADSKGIKDHLINTYNINKSKVCLLEYGAYLNKSAEEFHLKELELEAQNYYLIVSRLEPENNIEMMIDGYVSANTNIPLVIVGNVLNTDYVNRIKKKESNKIIFLGGIYDPNVLQAVRFFCKAHFHGHSVGGTNPSLLEAMGSGNMIVAHDNIYNREVTGNQALYFSSPIEFRKQIHKLETLNIEEAGKTRDYFFNRIYCYYNWDLIAKRYLDFFNSIINENNNY